MGSMGRGDVEEGMSPQSTGGQWAGTRGISEGGTEGPTMAENPKRPKRVGADNRANAT